MKKATYTWNIALVTIYVKQWTCTDTHYAQQCVCNKAYFEATFDGFFYKRFLEEGLVKNIELTSDLAG